MVQVFHQLKNHDKAHLIFWYWKDLDCLIYLWSKSYSMIRCKRWKKVLSADEEKKVLTHHPNHKKVRLFCLLSHQESPEFFMSDTKVTISWRKKRVPKHYYYFSSWSHPCLEKKNQEISDNKILFLLFSWWYLINKKNLSSHLYGRKNPFFHCMVKWKILRPFHNEVVVRPV